MLFFYGPIRNEFLPAISDGDAPVISRRAVANGVAYVRSRRSRPCIRTTMPTLMWPIIASPMISVIACSDCPVSSHGWLRNVIISRQSWRQRLNHWPYLSAVCLPCPTLQCSRQSGHRRLRQVPCHGIRRCRNAKDRPNPALPRQVAGQGTACRCDAQFRDAEIDEQRQRCHPKSVVMNRFRPVATQQFMGRSRDPATGTLKPCQGVERAKRDGNAGWVRTTEAARARRRRPTPAARHSAIGAVARQVFGPRFCNRS